MHTQSDILHSSFSDDAIAARYAAVVDDSLFTAEYERPAILAMVPSFSGCRILDAGCGGGWYAEKFLRGGAHVTAMDSSAVLLGRTKQRLENIGVPAEQYRLAHASLTEPLTFLSDSSIDVVVAALVLHYLEDWSVCLGEFRRVLAPGGCLLVSTHNPTTLYSRTVGSFYQHLEPVEESWAGIGRVQFFRRPLAAVVKALSIAGFGIDAIEEPIPSERFWSADPVVAARLIGAPEFLVLRCRLW